MLHAAGARLGPYEILGLVGSGGMGDVYRARDTRLERTVAVKVAKEAFGERFRNEALAVAALNHPHIGTLYDVGPDYLVMEYVDGKPLRGPLSVADALRLAGQIADALEHAHKHGIVHRDLKASNILVTKAGVKVVDFGLAQRRSPGSAADDSQLTLSEDGTLLGTPRYMAPEQIDGKRADERTDIFAFGLVLYEMLTGQRAFDGKNAAGVMAAILEKNPPPISASKPGTPPALEKVVSTCLAKDPADRWQSVRELKHALEWAAQTAPAPGVHRAWIVAAAAGVLAVASGGALLTRSTAPPRPLPVRFFVGLPPNAQLAGLASPVVSPDGRRIALALDFPDNLPQVFVRPLDALSPTVVPGSDRGSRPFWSPDSRQIAFWRASGGLMKVNLGGGPPQLICKECLKGGSGVGYGATWGPTDVIVYSDAGRLFRVSARGGEPEPLGALVPGETGRFWPQFLPDGRHYIYLSLAARREDAGIYLGALDSDLRQRIVATEHTAAYSPPGYLVYVKDEALVAQRFDPVRHTLSDEPLPILDEDVARFGGAELGGVAAFSVSGNGVLAWRPAAGDERQLTWYDRAGRKIGTIGPPSRFILQGLSPDGRTAGVCPTATNRDIWLVELASGASRRLTFDPHDDCGATFSPDGKKILFFSDRRGVRELYLKSADGSGDDELLLASDDFGLNPDDWSADGRFVSYKSSRPGQSHDLFVLPLSSEGRVSPVPFLATPASESFSALAPNGRYMAYMSDESGTSEVYVREITPPGKPGPGKWQVSQRHGSYPQWRPDGKELFFFDQRGLMAVDVRADGPIFEAGVPRPLGVTRRESGGARYYVSRDGQRFLFAAPATPSEPVRVLVNWLP
jgi:eukaryotic-like serine/threonine-protein kinase